LSGIANGLEAAIIEFISQNLKPIFCSPIALTFDDINDVVEKDKSTPRKSSSGSMSASATLGFCKLNLRFGPALCPQDLATKSAM
jgi:hypothetical protein